MGSGNDKTDNFLELADEPGLQKVVCPPELFIPVATPDLCRALANNLNAEQHTAFAAFVKLLESTCQFEYLDVRNQLKKDFQPFSYAAAKLPLPLAKREAPPSDEVLDAKELDFVSSFDALLEAAHYKRLSREEWETAEREEFTFTMPVDVDWSKNDTSLIGRFWSEHPEQQAAAAEIADRILVYHRGISTATASGLYIVEKIDLLVAYLVAGPLTHLLVKYFPKLGETQMVQAVLKMGDGVEEVPEPPRKTLPADLQHKHAKVIYRSSLERQMPTTMAVFSNLFKTLQLSEPQFRSVVVLFREKVDDKPLKPPPPPAGQEKALPPAPPNADFNEALQRRNIHIKRFEEIPMADTEIIFPDKRIFLKPITILQLAVTLIGGLVAAIATLAGSNHVSMSLIGSIIVLLAGRASQVYFSANMQRQAMSDAMTKALYDKTRDSQEGVLYRLLDEITDQHVKEALLAYIILLTSSSGVALSEEVLDAQCEAYLAQRFGQYLDFHIDGALPGLIADGIVWRDSKGLLTPVPLEEAVQKLHAKWGNLFSMDAAAKATQNPRLANIVQRLDREPVAGDEIDREELGKLLSGDGVVQQRTGTFTAAPGPPMPSITPIRLADPVSPEPHKGGKIGSMIKSVVSGKTHEP